MLSQKRLPPPLAVTSIMYAAYNNILLSLDEKQMKKRNL